MTQREPQMLREALLRLDHDRALRPSGFTGGLMRRWMCYTSGSIML